MKPRFYFIFIIFTLLFLTYPGDSYFFQIFAENRNLFGTATNQPLHIILHPIPYLKDTITPLVTAEGVYVTDLDSFTPLYEKNAHSTFYPASTTKIITALVAYDLYKLEDVITVKSTINEGQLMGLVVGEKITVENLLYGTLIHSGNDAAYILADNYGFDKFIKLMNQKAEQLGMADTHFENSNGLDNFKQVTSPFDLAIAARELLHNKFLKKVVAIKEISISDVDFTIFHRLSNVNKLLGEIQGIGGLKTGYTENAGENLVSFYRYKGHDYIIVILKSLDRFEDTRVVTNWIKSSVDYLPVAKNSNTQ